ncbi:MAG: hypothetical protein PHC90_05800 [Syntrophorhabdaceae bacterium]|nr:hypothetical protein [Syntrophorhabdaceae bacterium]
MRERVTPIMESQSIQAYNLIMGNVSAVQELPNDRGTAGITAYHIVDTSGETA